jgi:hypothetical protein
MPYLNGPILPRGAVVNLRIEVSAPRALVLRNAGQTLPPPVNLRGLIDTGADVTCIDINHVPFLAQQIPAVALVGAPAGGWTIGLQYDASLTVLHPQGGRRANLTLSSIPIVDLALAPFLGYEAVVGRDVLERCLLIYEGQTSRFTLGY